MVGGEPSGTPQLQGFEQFGPSNIGQDEGSLDRIGSP